MSTRSPAVERMPEPRLTVYVPLRDWNGNEIRNDRAEVRPTSSGWIRCPFAGEIDTSGVTVNGPVIVPPGPISERTCAGVKLATSIARSNTTERNPTEL